MRTIRRTTRSRSCRRPRITRSIACWAWPTRSTTALASRCLRAWPARRGPALVIATAPRPVSLSARIRLAANKLQPPVTRDCAKCAIAASRMQCAPVRSRRVHPAVDGEARIAERSRRHAHGHHLVHGSRPEEHEPVVQWLDYLECLAPRQLAVAQHVVVHAELAA